MDREQAPRRQMTESLFLESAQAKMQLLQRHWKNAPVTYSAAQLRKRLQLVLYGSAQAAPNPPSGAQHDAHIDQISNLLLEGRPQCDILEVLVYCWDQVTSRCGYFYVIRYDRGFVDQYGRHYAQWSDWRYHNSVPAHIRLCFPRDGQYMVDANGKVLVEVAHGNANSFKDDVARMFGLVSTSLALVCAIVPINELFLPFLVIANRVACLVAFFLALRDLSHLVDRYRRRLCISLWHVDQRTCWLRIVLSGCNLLVALPVRITQDFVKAGMDPPTRIVIVAVLLSFSLLAAATTYCLDLTARLLRSPREGRWLELGRLALSLIVLSRCWQNWLNIQALALETLAFSLGWHPPTTPSIAGSSALGSVERFPRAVPSPRGGSIFFAEAATFVEQPEDVLAIRIQREFYAQTHVDLAQRLASMQQLYDEQRRVLESAAKFVWFEFDALPLLRDSPVDERAVFLSADRRDAASAANVARFLARERI